MTLPRHKSDLEAVEALKRLSHQDLVPLIPELLEWLQDINWPVAGPIAELLSSVGTELVEPIRAILRSDDDAWKASILGELLCDVESSVRIALGDEIVRILNSPTPGEKHEGVVPIATDVWILLTLNDEPREP